MKYIILCFFLVSSANAQMLGNVETVGVHTVTHHDPGKGANDGNLGGFVVTDKGYTAGAYYNSQWRIAYYAGWTTPEWYRMKVTFLGVTGYSHGITPFIVPSVKLYQFDGPSLWLSGSPFKVGADAQSVLHLSLSWSIN